jgi:Secretion system C-terminal sorting domain
MKKILLMSLMALSSSVFAQTTVGFAVEIPAGTPVDSVDVTGDWINPAGLGTNWGDNLNLTLVAGKYVGSATVPNGTYRFKYRSYSGGIISWEQVPPACGVTADLNREMILTGAPYAAGPFCIGTCNAACGTVVPVNVNLITRVDMSGVIRTIPAGCTKIDMVNVTGSFGADAGFADWTPGSMPMTEVYAGSNIYERTLAVKSKVYAYKFLRANDWDFTDSANVKTQFSEQKDSFAVQTCLAGSDRTIDLTAAAAGSTTVAYYKWQSCTTGKPLAIGYTWKETIFTAQPNPFNGNTTILFTNTDQSAHQLKVINAMGQVVFSKANITNNRVEIGNLVSGIYTAILRTADGTNISLRLSAQ